MSAAAEAEVVGGIAGRAAAAEAGRFAEDTASRVGALEAGLAVAEQQTGIAAAEPELSAPQCYDQQ